jgi:hypothetical protein
MAASSELVTAKMMPQKVTPNKAPKSDKVKLSCLFAKGAKAKPASLRLGSGVRRIPMSEPLLTDWTMLDEEERVQRVAKFNPYTGEGEDLIRQIVVRFRDEFGHLPGLEIDHGIYHGGDWVIGVSRPFIFDRRLLPNTYLGVGVRTTARPPLPQEFQGQKYPQGYVWSPPNYERFVDRCANEIRERLGNPTMTRTEMLNALVGRPFEEHLAACRRWVKEGKIPPFE